MNLVAHLSFRGDKMKRQLFGLSIKIGRINEKHIRIAIATGVLALLALGAGAPFGVTDF